MCVKRAERCRQSIDLCRSQPAAAQGRLKGRILLKPAHDDQPIDDGSIARDRETRGREREWHDAQIDIRSEPPVQQIFRAAGRLAPVQGRKIEIGEANGFLEFVNAVAGHEDPGHVGFARDHLFGDGHIGRRIAEKPDLVTESGRIRIWLDLPTVAFAKAPSKITSGSPPARLDPDQGRFPTQEVAFL